MQHKNMYGVPYNRHMLSIPQACVVRTLQGYLISATKAHLNKTLFCHVKWEEGLLNYILN